MITYLPVAVNGKYLFADIRYLQDFYIVNLK